MKNISKVQLVLLCVPPILCVSMLLLMPFLTNIIGKTAGYIIGFCIYWFVFCVPFSLYIGLKKIYCHKSDIGKAESNVLKSIAFLPCIATFFVVIKEFATIAGFKVLIIALLFAITNGTFEEMFWRGAFNRAFNNKIFLAYIYPTIFFGIWHIALYYAEGIEYQGGFASLVGGSFFMGLLWGWVAYKTKSIKAITIAHILTNFFAFTGMIFENWIV